MYGEEGYLSHSQAVRLRDLIARRLTGEPLAYIVGRREFYGLDLEVNQSVLIPRQETELLADLTLEYLSDRNKEHGRPTIVDVGTGSGAIALAVAVHSEDARIVGIDISRDALDVASRNRARLCADGVEFIQGDLLTSIAGPVDVIVSNPPYIPSDMLGSLSIEVQREPVVALHGGPDGLDHFRCLATQADERLAPGGMLIVELMPEQMDAAISVARRSIRNINTVSARHDLMGNRRALVAKLGESCA